MKLAGPSLAYAFQAKKFAPRLCHVPTFQSVVANELTLEQIIQAGIDFMDEKDELLFDQV